MQAGSERKEEAGKVSVGQDKHLLGWTQDSILVGFNEDILRSVLAAKVADIHKIDTPLQFLPASEWYTLYSVGH